MNGRLLLLKMAVAAACWAQSYQPEALRQADAGMALAKKQDYQGAVQAYRRALAIDARVRHLYLNLGLAYFKQGQFRQALEAFSKEPPSDQITMLSGMSHFGLGEYKEAAVVLGPLAIAQPDNSELGYLLAKCYLWAGQSEKAMEIFRRLLERNSDSAPVHMLMAEALDADDREAEATKEFEAAVGADARLPEVHFGLGYLYWKQKRFHEAEREFRLELQGNPAHALSLAYTGDLMLRGGRLAEAVQVLKKAEELNSELHVVHQDLGIYYRDQGRVDLAVKQFQEAVRTAPENYDAHYRLARIYRQAGRRVEADQEFAIVQKLHAQAKEAPLMRISGP